MMFDKASRIKVDLKVRSHEIRSLVHELNAFRRIEINEVLVEKGFGDYIIKIESSRFRSANPNVGLIRIHVTDNEFWARHGAAYAALKDKITDALREL